VRAILDKSAKLAMYERHRFPRIRVWSAERFGG
jgi:hypothetical protein